MPYPVDVFERKLQASADRSTMECASDSDKPRAFTPQQIKQENQDPEEVGQGNQFIQLLWISSEYNIFKPEWVFSIQPTTFIVSEK